MSPAVGPDEAAEYYFTYINQVPDGFSPDAWARRGIASGYPVSVRALAYIAAGHVTHRCRILRERYL